MALNIPASFLLGMPRMQDPDSSLPRLFLRVVLAPRNLIDEVTSPLGRRTTVLTTH
jgi:hypothetical protein